MVAAAQNSKDIVVTISGKDLTPAMFKSFKQSAKEFERDYKQIAKNIEQANKQIAEAQKRAAYEALKAEQVVRRARVKEAQEAEREIQQIRNQGASQRFNNIRMSERLAVFNRRRTIAANDLWMQPFLDVEDQFNRVGMAASRAGQRIEAAAPKGGGWANFMQGFQMAMGFAGIRAAGTFASAAVPDVVTGTFGAMGGALSGAWNNAWFARAGVVPPEQLAALRAQEASRQAGTRSDLNRLRAMMGDSPASLSGGIPSISTLFELFGGSSSQRAADLRDIADRRRAIARARTNNAFPSIRAAEAARAMQGSLGDSEWTGWRWNLQDFNFRTLGFSRGITADEALGAGSDVALARMNTLRKQQDRADTTLRKRADFIGFLERASRVAGGVDSALLGAGSFGRTAFGALGAAEAAATRLFAAGFGGFGAAFDINRSARLANETPAERLRRELGNIDAAQRNGLNPANALASRRRLLFSALGDVDRSLFQAPPLGVTESRFLTRGRDAERVPAELTRLFEEANRVRREQTDKLIKAITENGGVLQLK